MRCACGSPLSGRVCARCCGIYPARQVDNAPQEGRHLSQLAEAASIACYMPVVTDSDSSEGSTIEDDDQPLSARLAPARSKVHLLRRSCYARYFTSPVPQERGPHSTAPESGVAAGGGGNASRVSGGQGSVELIDLVSSDDDGG